MSTKRSFHRQIKEDETRREIPGGGGFCQMQVELLVVVKRRGLSGAASFM